MQLRTTPTSVDHKNGSTNVSLALHYKRYIAIMHRGCVWCSDSQACLSVTRCLEPHARARKPATVATATAVAAAAAVTLRDMSRQLLWRSRWHPPGSRQVHHGQVPSVERHCHGGGLLPVCAGTEQIPPRAATAQYKTQNKTAPKTTTTRRKM